MFIDLLFILFLIHYFMCRRISFPYVKEGKGSLEYLQKLDNYYIRNKPYTFFMVILYVCLTVLPFMLLKIMLFGVSINMRSIENALSLIFLLVLIVLNIIYYFRILTIIFYPYAVRLHIYLRIYTWYAKFADNHQQTTPNYGYLSKIIGKVTILFDKWFVKTIIRYIEFNINKMLYDVLYSCLFFCFIHDMYHQKLYVSLFVGVFLVINIFMRKISYFLRIKDTECDNILTAYFYKNDIPYKEVRKNIFAKSYKIPIMLYNKNVIGEQGNMVLSKEDSITTYILDGFKSIHFYDHV
jgi:hypothetical protein